MEKQLVRGPFSGEVVGEFNQYNAQDVEQAAVQVVAAFEKTRRLAPFERADILDRAAKLVAERKDQLTRTIALEAAKPIQASRLEAERCALTLASARDETRRLGGEVFAADGYAAGKGHFALARRFAAGPVLGISPFNFPLNLVAHKVAPAIAAGCSILIKPASATPLSALALAAIFEEAGAPQDAVRVVPCSRAVGDRLIGDDRFKVMSFTGSAEVGWEVKARAGRKRVVLELGGNAAVAVHEDADLEDAAKRVVSGSFGYAGQSCISIQRIFVHRPIYQRFVDDLVERTKALKLGDPLLESTDLGPVIDDKAADRLQKWINQAVQAGATKLCGGGRDGRMLEPTLLADVAHNLPLFCEEAFGPVAVIEAYDDFDKMLATVNETRFGLQAGIFTRDMGRIMRAYEQIEAGAVCINQVPTSRLDPLPYGGVKDSGLGREGPRFAMEDYSELRLLLMRLG